MQHFLWGKVVLVLVAVVAVLQVVHLILLSRLEARHHHHDDQSDQLASAGNEVEAAFAVLVRSLHQGRVLDSSGEYQLVPNLAPATRLPQLRVSSSLPDIALVTQCSFNHLHRVVTLIQRWQGPISVAVFAEDHDLSEALWTIVGLRLCYSAIRHNVSFQLVSPLPAGGRPPLSVPQDPAHPCQLPTPSRSEQQRNYAGSRRFPNNLLRNVARRGAATEFVLVVDIDMLPSVNLRQDFYDFAVKNRLFTESHREDKTVYVVPAFEVRETVPVPRHKAELLQLADQGHLRPFYIELCWKCQVCELHVAGYKFSVLNNGFLVHHGLKTATSFHVNKDMDQERNRMLFRQFKTELRDKYPESSRRCY
ncbi:beta-1,4-glucuronyltransferase 1 isoform X2 [Anabrus simplex]|uniref:beta-1,4-glucuronyltransferase 1 isoform X2 n=1 Tax=Anabrus simplex TaxID=316456 RepID=UPI0035A2BBB2